MISARGTVYQCINVDFCKDMEIFHFASDYSPNHIQKLRSPTHMDSVVNDILHFAKSSTLVVKWIVFILKGS